MSRKSLATTDKKQVDEEEEEDEKIQKVRLVCFNIHNGFAAEDDETCTLDQTIAWLAKERPDVVCFQEVSWRFVSRARVEKAVRDKLGLSHFAYGFAAELYGTFFGQMTCSRFPIASHTNLELVADPIEHEGRNALVTHLSLDGGADAHASSTPFFTVINTHLDAWDGTEKTRLAQVKQLVTLAAKLREGAPTIPIMLVGDFNAVRRQDYATQKAFDESNRWQRALTYLMKHGDAQDVFDRLGKRAIKTRPYSSSRIDFAWLLPPHETIRVVDAAFATHVATSDHYPIVTNLAITL